MVVVVGFINDISPPFESPEVAQILPAIMTLRKDVCQCIREVGLRIDVQELRARRVNIGTPAVANPQERDVLSL